MSINKLVLVAFAIFCLCISIGSVSANEYSDVADNLSHVDDSESVDNLNEIDAVENEVLSQNANPHSEENLSVSENNGDILAQEVNASENVLSSSVSVSSGHTYKKLGYTFKVSAGKYAKIKDAIKMGKKQKFLDEGFEFKVKTNKVIKVKVLKKTKTYYKKVRYEGFKYYTYECVKLANLKNYYKNGWKKYFYGSESSYGKSKKYLGYNYAKLKKVVKTYKTVKMRVYATISYEGIYDYDGYGPQYYFPVVEFNAMKSGYKSKYLDGTFLR